MTDEHDLLKAICSDPDDDTIRLIYADWLDDNGRLTRADFIRAQIEYAQAQPGDPLYRYSLWRNKAHEHTTSVTLRASLPDFPGIEFGNFSRGFADDIHVEDARALRASAPRVFGTFPVRSLRVRSLREPAILADTPQLAFVRRLNLIYTRLTIDALRIILASPYLNNLTFLELDSNALPNDMIGALVEAAPNLPALRHLQLGGNRVTDNGAVRLAQSLPFSQLHTLDLSNNLLGSPGAIALARSPHLAALNRLVLAGCGPVSPETIQALKERFGAKVQLPARMTELERRRPRRRGRG